jgi:crotonobetainyl-CoA:carnitine CoA-transferase CaiB-like acyl-CoA transferase
MSRLNGFLEGVRVLDLSFYIPGPMATLFLSDMGARVLKIEPPQGDEMIHLGPRDRDGGPVFYRALNAGKSVRRLNLKQEGDRTAFLELAQTHDVLVEGFRPDVTRRLGVDYPTLSRINPRLVYCSISGYGAVAENTGRAAHDGNFLAESGVLDRNGATPRFFDPPLSDACGGLFAAIAILGALNQAARTGRGAHIDIGLADVMAPLQLMQIAAFGANGQVLKSDAAYLNGGAAYYQIYRTRDGRHVMLGALELKFWRLFCEAAGRPQWIARHAEPIPQLALKQDVQDFFASLDLERILALFAEADCCLSPVLDLGEAVHSGHVRSRGLVREDPHIGALQSLFPAYVDGAPPRNRAPVQAPEST